MGKRNTLFESCSPLSPYSESIYSSPSAYLYVGRKRKEVEKTLPDKIDTFKKIAVSLMCKKLPT